MAGVKGTGFVPSKPFPAIPGARLTPRGYGSHMAQINGLSGFIGKLDVQIADAQKKLMVSRFSNPADYERAVGNIEGLQTLRANLAAMLTKLTVVLQTA